VYTKRVGEFQHGSYFFVEKKKKLKKQKKNRAPQVVGLVSPTLFRNIAPGDLHSSCYLSGKNSLKG
jgi:hypothetical protein